MPREQLVYLDIETIPTQSAAAKAYLSGRVKAPSNYKDAEKIARAKAEAAEKAIENSVFDGWLGRIVCIGYAINDGSVVTHSTASDLSAEASAIRSLFKQFEGNDIQTTIVGHNVAGFDIPFITARAAELGIRLPPAFRWPRDPKPWDRNVHDTQAMAVGSRNTISLDKLCFALGIPGKDGFDGSMVHDAWQRGEHERIAEYCADDVERVRSIHKRFMAVGW